MAARRSRGRSGSRSNRRHVRAGGAPFDTEQKFARTQKVVSKAKIHFNKRWSWAVETGDFYWHCESCKATFELFPVTDEAWHEHGIAEIAWHK